MTIGIYKINNIENGNTYIGQSKNIEGRIKIHKESLKRNIHHQKNLQKEYNFYKDKLKNKYKDNETYKFINFDKLTVFKHYKFEVTEKFKVYNKSELLEVEDNYIIKYRGIQRGYSQKTNLEIGTRSKGKKLLKPKKEKILIKVENLNVGQVIPNYRKLCEILEIKISTGEVKINQIKKLKSLCKFKREANKYIIQEIYNK